MAKSIVIIGNGISGITTARHIRKLDDTCRITVISGETPHFFSRTALMYVYMGHLKFEHTKPYEDWFWAKNRIDLVQGWVTEFDFNQQKIAVNGQSNSVIEYDTLVLALGSKPNFYDWPGQDLRGVQGLYSKQDLDTMERDTAGVTHGVIVGGGLIGIEMAEMLRSRGIGVTFLVRESSFWNNVLPAQESVLINEHIAQHHVDLRLGSELSEILPGQNGRVGAVVTKDGETIDCQFVGLTVGVSPNVSVFKNQNNTLLGTLEIDRGILVDAFLQTNQPHVYAVGDCVQHRMPPPGRRAVEQIWYTGRIMGETLAQTLCGKPTAYQPGVFFNSAKFFDIEYQTYGDLPAQLPAGCATFYWDKPGKNTAVRINYDQASGAVLGMNAFGIRQRHEVWDGWIAQKKTIQHVLQHLPEANFDPEFFKQHEGEIIGQFNAQTGSRLAVKSKKGLARMFS